MAIIFRIPFALINPMSSIIIVVVELELDFLVFFLVELELDLPAA